jgi:hypothetical protein
MDACFSRRGKPQGVRTQIVGKSDIYKTDKMNSFEVRIRLLETYWGSLAQVGATIVAIFAGVIGAFMVYLKQKQDEVNAQDREKKLELADLLSTMMLGQSTGSVSFFAGEYDSNKLQEASSDFTRFIAISELSPEKISETGNNLMKKLRVLGQLLPSITWQLLSYKFTGIDSTIADLSDEEYEQWSQQMFDYSTVIESIWSVSKERLQIILLAWEESWEGATLFLSKEGVERFFNTFSSIKDSLFEIQRIQESGKGFKISTIVPFWQLTLIGLFMAFFSAVVFPLFSLIYNLDGFYPLLSLFLFSFSMMIAVIPFLARTIKEKHFSYRVLFGDFRHIKNVLERAWRSRLSPIPKISIQRILLVECKNVECRKEFSSGIQITSSERVYKSKNIDSHKINCPHCGKSNIYNRQDFHF